MTGIFKANNPYNSFLLLVYGLLLKLPVFLHPVIPIQQKTDGFLFKILLAQLFSVGKTFPAIYPIISFVLLFTQAIAFNKLVNDQKLMQKSNYLTAMSYLLVTSIFTQWNILSSALIINTLLIWVWAKMSSLYNNQKPKTALFNIGLAIGCATFFYFPAIAFSALIVFGLVVTRPFKLAEWLTAFLGIITPYYFLLAYVFLTDKWKGYKFPGVAFGRPIFFETKWVLAAIILVLISTGIGLYYIRANFLRQLVQTRKSWNLVLLYFVVSVIIPFINATHTFKYWILCAVPLSAFLACAFFYPQKKSVPLLLHWLMVAFVIAFSLLPQ